MASIVGLILLSLMFYVGRGVLRSSILPAYASARHKNQLEATLNNELLNVNKSLQPLGLKFVNKGNLGCELDIARKLRTSVFCSGEDDTNRELTSILSGSALSVNQTKQAMTNNGWHGGVDSSESSLWLQYDKSANGFDCTVQIIRDADQTTLDGRIFCSQTYSYFGDPYDEHSL